ncbi:unnamed protein product [Bathycoccus prasinos]
MRLANECILRIVMSKSQTTSLILSSSLLFMADEAKRQAQLEAGRKKLETFKARKSLLKQQQQQKEKEKKEEGETTIQTTTTPKRDEIFEQQRQQQQEEFHTPNALVSSSSTSTCDDSKTKATTTMVMQDEIEKIVREAVEKESAKLKRKFEEDVDELKQKHEEAREETEKEKKEFEDLKMEEMRKRMEEEKENFQTQSTERINELQEKVQKAVKKGKSMQAERDEIKSAFDALTTQSEELVKTIEIANERSGNAEKELGETKIQLQAKEKEFADLKSFYEENNASNLNEEERLKMELTETNAKMEEMARKVDDAENETETVKSELRAKREEFDDLKQLFDDTAANATRGEEGLKEEIVALREQTNALKEELTTAAQTSEEKAKMLERELENEVSTRMSLETEVEELRHANAQSTDSLRAEFERAKEENEAIKLKCEAFEREINEELKPKCEELEREINQELKPKCDHFQQELSVAQEEISGQFQLGVERDEAQRKLAEAEQALEVMRKERDDLENSSSAAHEEALGKLQKELGEATIALRAKEKEFADLKSFYEENNASNLNEEERLKLELIETKTTLGEANEKIAQLELDARTVSNERYDLIAQIDQYKKQMGDLEKSFDAHKSDEDSLREEKATFLGKINALESERGELFARNEKILNDLEEMTKLKNAQSEKVQKAVKKGKSIQADLVETKKTLGAKEQEVIDLQQRVDALVNAEPTTPQQQQEEGKYVALLAEKDATIASVLEREAKASAHVETIQKQVDDLIVKSNASADKVASIENELAHSREAVANAEREIGETKIQLQAKEKEFADLKSFYEENNASNLNEEERLKMELNEANANTQLVREEVETLKKKLTEQDERSLAAANEQHSEQIQLLQATIAEARDEGNRERVVAESLKQELDVKVSEVQKMKIEIEHNAEKLEEINAEKEMFMSECEKALESFDREKAKAKELKQKLKDFDHESKTSAQMKMEEHENALRAASERATFLEEELSKVSAALTQASENVQRGPSAEELEREKQEQQRELHELKSRLDQELQGMNVLREQLQEERGKRAQLDARLAASLAAQQQQQATTTQHTGASEQKQPSPHHRFTNKKNEDYGDDDDETMLNDIEGAIISGGSYSFVPLQGKFKSLTFCPPLQSSGCLQAANMFDRFSVFLQRRPTLRVLLIGYFALLHVLLFLF